MKSIRRKSDFQKIFKFGSQIRPCDWLILAYCINHQKMNRYGWTIPKYVGIAVLRNKLRRWCREFFRERLISSESFCDINIVFRRKDRGFFKNVKREELFELLQKGMVRLENQNR